MKEIFALVDCNNFYVSCERVFNPILKNKPVVILSNNDGCIISRSEEAKKFGVPMAAPLYKCEDIIKENNISVFSSNYSLYGDLSMRVMQVLDQLAPEIEIYSIDEAFLLLTKIDGDLYEYGKVIREKVGKWVGIPVSVGIGPTKTLAKLASRLAKKTTDGVFKIEENQIDEVLKTFVVSDVWGIGRRKNIFLNSNDVFTALDLKNKDDRWIKMHLSITGLRTVTELRGISCISLESAPASKKGILCSRSFGRPVLTIIELKEAVATYTTRAAEKLRLQKSAALYIHVFVKTKRYKDGKSYYSNFYTAQLDTPTSFTPDLIKCATNLLEKIFKPGYKYYKTGVMLTGLVPENSIQINIFSSSIEVNKNRDMMKAMDTINKRWGANTVQLAASGTKKAWKMKQEKRSSQFTTNWDDLLNVNAN